MPVLLVVCDTKSQTLRQRLAAVIEVYGDPLALSESSYLLDTFRLPDDLADVLRKKIGFSDRDSLAVFTVSPPFKGRVPPKVKQWLETVRAKSNYTRAPARKPVAARTL